MDSPVLPGDEHPSALPQRRLELAHHHDGAAGLARFLGMLAAQQQQGPEEGIELRASCVHASQSLAGRALTISSRNSAFDEAMRLARQSEARTNASPCRQL